MDFTDILIFVLAAIGMVVSAVAKNAKKKTEEARRLAKPEAGEWKAKEYHFPEYDDIILQQNDDPAPPTHKNPYWSYDQETIKERDTSVRIDDTNRKPKQHRQIIDNKPSPIHDQAVPENHNGSPAQQFNLRDAIIYSELLKPKHEEY